MNPAGIGLGILLLIVAILGFMYVTAPSIDVMFGAVSGEEENLVAVVGGTVLLWLTTGVFIAMFMGGVFIALIGIAS